MYDRASRDVHAQEPPPAFSMSINLMVASVGLGARDQYWFDLERSVVTGYVQTPATSRIMLCRLARWFPNESTAGALEEVATTAVNARVRSAAYESLAALRPGDGASVWQRALADTDPLVRHAATTALDGPDGSGSRSTRR